jgi:hypothetical protein
MANKHAEHLTALKKQLDELRAALESEETAALAEWPASSAAWRAKETLSTIRNDVEGIQFALQRLEGWLN